MKKNKKLITLFTIIAIYGCTTPPNNVNQEDKVKETITPSNPNVTSSSTVTSTSIPKTNSSVSPMDMTVPPTIQTVIPTFTSSPSISVPPSSVVIPTNSSVVYDPEKSEFRVSKTRSLSQDNVSVVLADDGYSIVTWAAVENSSIGIYAQKFDSQYKPDGQEFKVNTINIERNESTYSEILKVVNLLPKVILDNDGFIISWTNNGKLYLRKYNKSGIATSSELNPKINLKNNEKNLLLGSRGENIILADKNGTYFIIGAGISGSEYSPSYGQLYDKDFNPINEATKLPAEPARTYSAKDNQGNILLIFWKYSPVEGLYGQRYKSDGTQLGEEFKLNDMGKDLPKLMASVLDKDENFIMVGNKQSENNLDWDIYVQKYDTNKNLKSIKVNTETLGFMTVPITKLAISENGDFVIVWGDEMVNYAKGEIYARRFNKNGEPKENQFKVNYLSKGFKAKPDISMNNNGDFLIAWPSWNDNTNSSEIYARKYNFNQELPQDNLALIPNENVDCGPNTQQANEIRNQQSYNGQLKITVKDGDKTIELNSKADFDKLPKIINPEITLNNININGQPYQNNIRTLTTKIKKTGCFEDIFNKYGITKGQDLFGFYYIYTNYDKAPINKIEELVRKFSIKENIPINQIEFSSPYALASFALYLDLQLNYGYNFEHLYFTPKAVAS